MAVHYFMIFMETIMQINSASSGLYTGHVYKSLEKSSPMSWSNELTASASTPIGVSFDANQVNLKSDELKQKLANVDLRNITPKDLANLGGYLFSKGEISTNADGQFILLPLTYDGMNPNKPIDAIKFLENVYASVNNDIKNGVPNMENAKNYLGDALHTIYNMDNFIQAIKSDQNIDVKA
jgi:hypothetical protein